MIYITGDTHADFTRFSNKRLAAKGLDLTLQDYVIVCGDFGLCWEENKTFAYNCQFFEGKPFTILWVQGNHENYDMIEKFTLEEWNGGFVRHIVRDKVILLERGQVFELGGKKIFTFGGAASRDIQGGILDRNSPDFKVELKCVKDTGRPYRILRESWWPQELPSEKQMLDGLKNLSKVDNKVDYIISHCCATSIQNSITKEDESAYTSNVLTDYFDTIEANVQYKHWYFGHYHDDKRIDDKHTLLYKCVIPMQ